MNKQTVTDPSQQYDLRILRALRRITRSIALHSRQLSAVSHITAPQLMCLRTVIANGPLTATAISREIHVSPSTVVGILDRLEDKGLIRRERGREDRRIVFVTATEAGRALAKDAPSPLQKHLADALNALPELEQATITLSLERIVALMEQDGHAPPPSRTPILLLPSSRCPPAARLPNRGWSYDRYRTGNPILSCRGAGGLRRDAADAPAQPQATAPPCTASSPSARRSTSIPSTRTCSWLSISATPASWPKAPEDASTVLSPLMCCPTGPTSCSSGRSRCTPARGHRLAAPCSENSCGARAGACSRHLETTATGPGPTTGFAPAHNRFGRQAVVNCWGAGRPDGRLGRARPGARLDEEGGMAPVHGLDMANTSAKKAFLKTVDRVLPSRATGNTPCSSPDPPAPTRSRRR